MERVGILGGTRFIGYHLTQELLRLGVHVTLFNRGRTLPPGEFLTPVETVRGDRDRPEDLEEFFRRDYDAIFDLSGYSLAQVEPVLRHYRSRIGHYIFCSTSSVLALPAPVPYSEEAPRVGGDGTYGGAKAAVEDFLLQEGRAHVLPVTIFRPQGVFGEHDGARVSIILNLMRHGLPISVPEKQRAFRVNYLDVRDLAKAFVGAGRLAGPRARIYNVANDSPVSPEELVALCGEFFHPPSSPVARRKLNGELTWDDCDMIADNRRLKADLGMTFTPLRESLEAVWDWVERSPSPRSTLKDKLYRLLRGPSGPY